MTSSGPAEPGRDCPCGRGGTFGGVLPYERCCGRYLDDAGTPAPDAESLMRSRYTAYALHRDAYVLHTWDRATRPARLRIDAGVEWTGLQVLDHRATGPDAAEVRFVATYRDRSGRAGRIAENSRFARGPAGWTYVDGDVD